MSELSERINAGCTCGRAGLCLRCEFAREVAELEAERDALRVEAERVGALVDTALINEVNALTADRDALKRECEGLRGALENLLPGLHLDLRYADPDDDREALQSRVKTVTDALALSPAEPKENG